MALNWSHGPLSDPAQAYDAAYFLLKATWAGGPIEPLGSPTWVQTHAFDETYKLALGYFLQMRSPSGPPPRAIAEEAMKKRVSEFYAAFAKGTAAPGYAVERYFDAATGQWVEQPVKVVGGTSVPVAAVPLVKATAPAPAPAPAPTPISVTASPLAAMGGTPMGMLQTALETVKQVGGAIGSVVKAGAEVLPVAAQVLAKTTPTQYTIGGGGGMASGYEQIWRALAPESAVEPYRGQQIYPQQMGEQTTRGFRITAPGVRADRFIVQPHPVTGMPFYWEAVGRPVLFSRDLAAARRVNRIAARAARGRGRRSVIRRRRKA
jgi:hypothetical protein